MANDFEDFEDYYNLYKDKIVKLPKRYIRDMDNIFDRYSDHCFKRRFRFEKETVINKIVPLIENYYEKSTNRGLPVPCYLQALITLRFYATASFQVVSADLFHVSESTVCRTINKVSYIFACNLKNFVKFPVNHDDFNTLKSDFQKYGFPGVIGLIDGTHIPIKSPGGEQGELYRNRKSFFSINVQVVGGPNEEILDVVVSWPGSTHDFRIFENSRVRVRLSEGELPGHLLGDSGYPQRSYLFTPVLHSHGILEERYNYSHIRTRSLIERTIGRWKRRFPCLYYELQNNLTNVQRIITACAVVYNIGIKAGDFWHHNGNIEIKEGPINIILDSVGANKFRQNFIVRHFNF